MALISVRGRNIRVQAKAGTQRNAVIRMYEAYSDQRLDQLEQESIEHEQASVKGQRQGELASKRRDMGTS
jgi:hypothetical protein